MAVRAAPMLATINLGKAFGSNVALDGVSLDVGEGELLGLIGPNGSGKSTLVNCVSGVLEPTSGSVRYAGMDVTRWSLRKRSRYGMVRTFQNLRLFKHMTVLENVAARCGAERVQATLHEFGLHDVQHEAVGTLSFGHQRRTELARALVKPPRVLLLDEPAAGLDSTERMRLASILKRRTETAMTIVLIDHDMSLISSICTRVVVMNCGQIIFNGSPECALADTTVREVYLGQSPD